MENQGRHYVRIALQPLKSRTSTLLYDQVPVIGFDIYIKAYAYFKKTCILICACSVHSYRIIMLSDDHRHHVRKIQGLQGS